MEDGGVRVASFTYMLLGWAPSNIKEEEYEEEDFDLLDRDIVTEL